MSEGVLIALKRADMSSIDGTNLTNVKTVAEYEAG